MFINGGNWLQIIIVIIEISFFFVYWLPLVSDNGL